MRHRDCARATFCHPTRLLIGPAAGKLGRATKTAHSQLKPGDGRSSLNTAAACPKEHGNARFPLLSTYLSRKTNAYLPEFTGNEGVVSKGSCSCRGGKCVRNTGKTKKKSSVYQFPGPEAYRAGLSRGFWGLWLISCDVLSQHPVQPQPHLVRNGYTAIHTYTLLLYNNGAAH